MMAIASVELCIALPSYNDIILGIVELSFDEGSMVVRE